MDILITADTAGITVREMLRSRLRYSSNMIKKLKFSPGGITVNGSFVTVRYVLAEGDTLSLALEDSEADVSPYTVPAPLSLDVIYEDEWITAVNKPPDMPSHPSHGHRLDTVSNALAYRYRDRNYVFRPVNRLDRDTSGCMLTANSRDAAYKMYLSMVSGRIRKTYLAVTDGVPDSLRGTLRSYLRRAEDSIVKRRVTSSDDPGGKEAVSGYEVIAASGCHSLVRLTPLTGRTHQLRLQLASVGCPITGDDLYGTASDMIARQALHSYITRFPHPQTDDEITVTAPLPNDMRRLVSEWFGEDFADDFA